MDAYFRCYTKKTLTGKSDLIVTCDSNYAGLNFICTNGTNTYTKTCPSSSPYEMLFEGLTNDTWTVKTTYNSKEYSDTVEIPKNIDLNSYKTITVTLYSAVNDIVSYTDVNGIHYVNTNSSGIAENISITFNLLSPNMTFTSSVAKSTTSFSSAYTKTVSLTEGTTSIRIMPDNYIYWFGIINESVAFTKASQITLKRNTNNTQLSMGGVGTSPYYYQTSSSQSIANKKVKLHVNSATLGRYNDNLEMYFKAGSTASQRVYTSAISNTLWTLSPTANGQLIFQMQPSNAGCQITFSSLWIE